MEQPKSNNKTAAIILGIAGVLAVGGIIGGIVYWRKKHEDDDDNTPGVKREGLLYAGPLDCTLTGAQVSRGWMQQGACTAIGGALTNVGTDLWGTCNMSLCPASSLDEGVGLGFSSALPKENCWPNVPLAGDKNSHYGLVGYIPFGTCKSLGGLYNEPETTAPDHPVRCHFNYGTCSGKGGTARYIAGKGKCPASKKSTPLVIDDETGAISYEGCKAIGGTRVTAPVAGCALDVCY